MKLDYSEILEAIRKHGPEILAATGIAGFIFTAVEAAARTPEAMIKIEEMKAELGVERLTVGQTIKAIWKSYALAAVVGIASGACIIGGLTESQRRIAALADTCAIAGMRLNDFKEQAKDILGEEKVKEIEEAVAKEEVKRDPPPSSAVVMLGDGEVLCRDTITKQYFRCSINKMEKIANDISRRMIYENTASLNDFYYEIGLEWCEAGDKYGWNINDGIIELKFTSVITDNGVPCIVVDYNARADYDRR